MLIHAHARTHEITVDLFDEVYVFKAHPENNKAFVAEVTAESAIARLLAIPEGYCEYGHAPVRARAAVPHTPPPDDGLTAAERELGFKLNPNPEDGMSAEARAFAAAEAARLQAEEEEEQEAQRERDRAIAEAAEREAAEAAQREAAAAAAAEAEERTRAAAAAAAAEAAAAAARFTLKASDGATVDLKLMDDAQLRAWAKANGVTNLNSKWNGDVLREKIVAAVTTPPAE